MNAKRVAALSALGLVILAMAVMLLRSGDSGYTLTAKLDNAGQLIEGNDVRIGAVKVGTITQVALADDGTVEIEFEVDEDTAPVPDGTKLAVRSTSLFGLANRFVVLQPPPGESEPLPDGATLGIESTKSLVEADALFDTLDRPTRRGIQQLLAGGATVYGGRTEEINETVRWLGPTFKGTALVMGELAKDQDAFAGLLNKAGVTARAVNARRSELVELISNANATTGAFANEALHLERAIGQLPATLRRSNTTFAAVRGALDDIDPFVAAALPNTRNLAKFLRNVRPFAQRSRGTVRNAANIVNKKGKNNDLRDLLATAPKLSQTASQALPAATTFMDDSEDTLDTLRAYTPDILAAVANLGQAAGTYDANGHYVRGLPVLGAADYNIGPNTLTPRPPLDRLDGFELDAGARCPGGAMQAPLDGSAPVIVPGCNPLLIPPGP